MVPWPLQKLGGDSIFYYVHGVTLLGIISLIPMCRMS